MEFEHLKAECIVCTKCPLCETRTNVVFGMGSPTAEVIFIGEAPGKNEDEQALPFVGRSGKLLDQYLEAIDLSRDKNIFIVNTVKCRPPENRDPLPEERNACRPWLEQQFQLLKPKIVVCLGRVAAQQMIRADFMISKEHGQFEQKDGIWYTAVLHPAALLRNPNLKPSAFEDFVALRSKIEEVCEHTYS